MAKKLKNLEITKVDFVDAGANQRADITLMKNKDGVPGTDNQGEQKKLNLAKRLLGIFTGSGVKEEELEQTVGKIEKAGFKDELEAEQRWRNLDKTSDQISDFTCAANRALMDSLWNNDLTPEQRATEMLASLNEFTESVTTAIESWKDLRPSESFAVDVAKIKGVIKDEAELKAFTKARDALSSIIDNPTGVVGTQAVNQPEKQEGAEEMKIDKSKMTEAERAFLDSIEKRYAVEDTTPAVPVAGTSQVAAPAGDVTKSAGIPGQTPDHTAPEQNSAPDIYKGLDPAVRAEIESLKKFKADAEDKELHDVAKRYEILGKKDEELFPVLKSLKSSGQDAYDQFVAGLDYAVQQVNKSAAFGEIGTTGAGTMPNTSIAKSQAEGKIDNIAKSYIEKDPTMTYQSALAKAWNDHPELYDEYEQETNV